MSASDLQRQGSAPGSARRWLAEWPLDDFDDFLQAGINGQPTDRRDGIPQSQPKQPPVATRARNAPNEWPAELTVNELLEQELPADSGKATGQESRQRTVNTPLYDAIQRGRARRRFLSPTKEQTSAIHQAYTLTTKRPVRRQMWSALRLLYEIHGEVAADLVKELGRRYGPTDLLITLIDFDSTASASEGQEL